MSSSLASSSSSSTPFFLSSASPSTSKASSPPTDCSICGIATPNITKLKTHLLLKHPKLHLCLFCVEKKGWSDSFASQAQYNKHYGECHEGRIEKPVTEKDRQTRRARWKSDRASALDSGSPAPKRPQTREPCRLCDRTFPHAPELNRHLIAVHGHDYCKLCQLVGVPPAVRFHLLEDAHLQRVCYYCLGSSPIFPNEKALQAHFGSSHGVDKRAPRYPCLDGECPASETTFDTMNAYKTHLLEAHLTKGDALKPMKRKYQRNVSSDGKEESPSASEVVYPSLKKVAGIVNDGGQDCFAIAAIQLLSQTELLKAIGNPLKGHRNRECTEPRCLIGNFLHQYMCEASWSLPAKKSKITLTSSFFSQHYRSLGVDDLPVDTGDFLRGTLSTVSDDEKCSQGRSDSISSLFKVWLEWKLECPECKRFLTMAMRDHVIRLDGSKPDSFQELLRKYLTVKECRCGAMNEVRPTVKSCGDYLFFEIDRACQEGNDSKEIVLYSLQLEHTYDLFGFKYFLMGTISYNLESADSDGGGHYFTYLFPNDLKCVRIHENEVTKMNQRPPDFDSDTVIVALKRMTMEAEDLGQIPIPAQPVVLQAQDDEPLAIQPDGRAEIDAGPSESNKNLLNVAL